MYLNKENVIKYQKEILKIVKGIKNKRASSKNQDDDSKTDPIVAALLLNEDGKTITSYRSEMLEGDHAEYNLFMNKLGGENHSNDILFVSLEPCSHDSRISTISCSELIVKSHIKKVYMGTFDPDPLVKGEGYTYLICNGVDVELFEEPFQKELIDINKDFFKSKIIGGDDFRRFYRDVCKNEIDKEAMAFYLMATSLDTKEKIINQPFDVLLKQIKQYNIDLQVFNQFYNDVLKKHYVYPSVINSKRTVECEIGFKLAFYKNPNRFYRGTSIRIIDKSLKLEQPPMVCAESNILSALKAIDIVIGLSKKYESGNDKKDQLFKQVLREMIINAVCHKSYNSFAPVIVVLRNNCIEIENPVDKEKVDIDALNEFSMPTNPTNGSLADIAIEVGAMEGSGKGSDDLKKYLQLFSHNGTDISNKKPYRIISDIMIVKIPYPNPVE